MVNKEKEKLLAELFGQKRNLDIYADKDVLNRNEAELNKIIQHNQKTLADLRNEVPTSKIDKIQEEVAKDFGVDVNLDALQAELESDYDIKIETPKTVVVGKQSREIFEKIEKDLNERVIGQSEACHDLAIAFRRPYVVGSDPQKIRNSIILTGNNGSGRHVLVREMAKLLKQYGLTVSDTVSTLDVARYQSVSQETLFLQDLYVVLNSHSGIINIENSEEGNPVFVRMLAELAVDGRLSLNKRYVFRQNQLQVATEGLTSEVIDKLDGNNKVLIFISEKAPYKLLDIYGKSFLDKIDDRVATTVYDQKSLELILDKLIKEFLVKCETQLEIEVTVDDSLKQHILSFYSPNDGVESIRPVITKIYDELVNLALRTTDFKFAKLVNEDKVYAIIGEEKYELKINDDASEERKAIQKELDAIVGLNEIKDYLFSLEDHIRVSKLRKQRGLKNAEVSKHMIFTGNPGTGKTTIARLVSRMMKASGILKQGHLVEVTRSDLVAKYVGQTAPQTMDVIKSALGGVLFIDEAYSLYRGKDDSFGLEAIDTLVKAMEDHRDDLIVILAGYSKEMSVFLDANTGLKSRFANIIDFKDYTGEELTKIAVSIANKKDYKIEERALAPLTEYFDKIQARHDMTSGNGRLARNLVEDAILKQSKRVLSDEKTPIDILILEDFDLKESTNEK